MSWKVSKLTTMESLLAMVEHSFGSWSMILTTVSPTQYQKSWKLQVGALMLGHHQRLSQHPIRLLCQHPHQPMVHRQIIQQLCRHRRQQLLHQRHSWRQKRSIYAQRMSLYQLRSALTDQLQVTSARPSAKRIVADEEERLVGGMTLVQVHQVPLPRLLLHLQRLQAIALLRALLVARVVTAAVVTAHVEERTLTSASKIIDRDFVL
mmetsp:Transcript_29063/g.41542  ORF Transcript_29063/g.41542 Transcript_29063/m.41542 type:complete len:207 (+) Transcript_29063:1440-2060(+)